MQEHTRQGGRRNRRSRRDRTPEDEPLENDEWEDMFTVEFRESDEIITPANFPSLVQEINKPKGVKRKHDRVDDEEEVLLYEDNPGQL